jgi:hypothetical protein
MDNYRVITDGLTNFMVEITHKNGGIHTTGGFHTQFAADAWMADRIAIAEAADTSDLAKLLHRS